MGSKKGKKTVKMSPELVDVLEKQMEAFRQKFGRDPGPDDPVFFDPNADTPQPFDGDELMRAMVEAMAEAGVDPARIYAYHKTRLLVTEENLHLLSEEDLAEWKSAIQEYKNQTKGDIS